MIYQKLIKLADNFGSKYASDASNLVFGLNLKDGKVHVSIALKLENPLQEESRYKSDLLVSLSKYVNEQQETVQGVLQDLCLDLDKKFTPQEFGEENFGVHSVKDTLLAKDNNMYYVFHYLVSKLSGEILSEEFQYMKDILVSEYNVNIG